jgi:hypothetical protein
MSKLSSAAKQPEHDATEETEAPKQQPVSTSAEVPANPPQTQPAETPAPIQERRSWPRRKKMLQVLVQDAGQENPPLPAWIVNRSLGGLCLSIDQPIEVGTILRVRQPSAPADIPWVEVQVMRLQAKENTWELGCQFTRALTWDLIMQFG